MKTIIWRTVRGLNEPARIFQKVKIKVLHKVIWEGITLMSVG